MTDHELIITGIEHRGYATLDLICTHPDRVLVSPCQVKELWDELGAHLLEGGPIPNQVHVPVHTRIDAIKPYRGVLYFPNHDESNAA